MEKTLELKSNHHHSNQGIQKSLLKNRLKKSMKCSENMKK